MIANIENITSGRGPISEHARYIRDLGVECMTLGDHAFDNISAFEDYLGNPDSPIIRPANFYEHPDFPLP